MDQVADKHMHQAQKCVTKPTFSLFWTADYDSSAQEYEKAAGCYKSCQMYEKSIHAFIQASQAWVQANSYFMAAKNMESAAHLTHLQLHNSTESASLLKQAADFFVLNSTPDRAAELLEKAAKMCEDANDSNRVLGFYDESIELYRNETRPRFAIDVSKKAFAFASKSQLSTKAIDYLDLQTQLYTQMNSAHNVSKSILSKILYTLSIGDTVKANSVFESGMLNAHLQQDEAKTAHNILDAINQADQDLLTNLVMKSSPNIQFLDQAIIRAARLISTDNCLPMNNPTDTSVAQIHIPGFSNPSVNSDQEGMSSIPGFVIDSLPAHTPMPGPTTLMGNEEVEEEEDEEGFC